MRGRGRLETEGDRRFDETLKALDLPACDDGLLILKRSVHATKAGRISVNGGSATLAQLQQLGELWIDFHGPGEPQKLMRTETQLEMLDLHAGLAAPARRLPRRLAAASRAAREAAEAAAAERLSEDEEAFLRSQLGETGFARPVGGGHRQARTATTPALPARRNWPRSSASSTRASGPTGSARCSRSSLKAGDDVARIDADAASLRDRLNSSRPRPRISAPISPGWVAGSPPTRRPRPTSTRR
jgi:DNA repair protein RecN (Recombination protein N)